MTDTSHMRLIIDLQKCDQCESCTVDCGYHDRLHTQEHGMCGLRERATFAIICRRCALASCIEACAFEALERGQDGILQRHNLRCVSCKMCAHACPFGTIYTDMLAFYQVNCEQCLENSDSQPPCVASCPHGALEYRAVESSETNVYIIDSNLAAMGKRWIRQELTA